MPPLLLKLVFDRVETAPMPFFVEPIARGIADKVQDGVHRAATSSATSTTWRASSARASWFAGDEFTAADIQMSFPLEAAAARGGLDAQPAEAHGLPGDASTPGRRTSGRSSAAGPTASPTTEVLLLPLRGRRSG